MEIRLKLLIFLVMTVLIVGSCARGAMPGSSPKKEINPDRSEPVPGAEILIEQENNDIPQPKK